MGVQGLTRYLEERFLTEAEVETNGWPTTDLFGTWSSANAFLQANHVQSLPRNATLLIDGNGLVFYLHNIAWARHLRSVCHDAATTGCPRATSLSTEQRNAVLPCMLPLTLLKEVTLEYITTLANYSVKIQIYWDGPSRRFKEATLAKRQETREDECMHLEQYCTHGILPNTARQNSIASWVSSLPMGRIVFRTVRSALARFAATSGNQIAMVMCEEEADLLLAKAATGKDDCFILGRDSDFLCFKNIQYTRFDALRLASDQIYATVWTREDVGVALGLHEALVPELALLLGNDYVDPKTMLDLQMIPKNGLYREEVMEFLVHQEPDFQVKVRSENAQAAVDFVRALYNLTDDLDTLFAIDDDTISDEDDKDDVEDTEDIEERAIALPSDFSKSTAVVLPTDASFSDAIVRCLQEFLDGQVLQETACMVLQQDHIDAYRNSMKALGSIGKQADPLSERLHWIDMQASYWIEACVALCLQHSTNTILGKLTKPEDAFDRQGFFSELQKIRLHKRAPEPHQLPKPFLDPIQSKASSSDIQDAASDASSFQGYEHPNVPEPVMVERKKLPIDDHRDAILDSIANNRVTIIHGETGCGKSSRVPIMLLESPPPNPTFSKVKLFMSQPRRIAAKALVERVRSCEPDHRDKFALRMGHGWREYESSKTQAWFVTTGYLTRLLANHPERFNSCTHLIIDEVHERSVDTDILCLLCRRLLHSNDRIRLILMSATLAAKMYQEYFGIPNEPIHVGVRTFPITEYFLEDLMAFQLPKKEQAAIKAIQEECSKSRCKNPPSAAAMSKRFPVAARLAVQVCPPGSSVLIFVPGMAEILAIMELINNTHMADVIFTCYPIHSDIPFEEQMDVFKTPAENEIIVIIATNAAESSVTLPSVDHVICLGLCKLIKYNERSHRQMLTPAWISRASALQRAGRTGRVRPGNVYRLYTKDAFQNGMEPFEPGEIVRTPLDSVILMLKQMLHEKVIPALCDCIEPPAMTTIERSFQSLHKWHFLTDSSDDAEITTLGAFVSALGVDLTLGSLIGLGIQFGVAAEAIEMAAILSFPKTPFKISSPMYHDASTYNDITSKTYIAKCHFDANLYSEPMALMNALWDFRMAANKDQWCFKFGFAKARLQQLSSTRDSLRKRVAEFLAIHENKLQLRCPPVEMPHAKITILRVLKVWVFSETLIEASPVGLQSAIDGSIRLKTMDMPKDYDNFLSTILDKDRHPYRVVSNTDKEQKGVFQFEGNFEMSDFMSFFEERLISYMIEMKIPLACVGDKSEQFYVMSIECPVYDKAMAIMESSFEDWKVEYANAVPTSKKRGVAERKCGMWEISKKTEEPARSTSKPIFCIFYMEERVLGASDAIPQLIDNCCRVYGVDSMLRWTFAAKGNFKRKKHAFESGQFFSVLLSGSIETISNRDLMDMLRTNDLEEINTPRQKTKDLAVQLHATENTPMPYKGKDKSLMALCDPSPSSSRTRPPFQDIPEGVRVISVLVSGRWDKGARVCFDPIEPNPREDTVDIRFKREETLVTYRWSRLGSGGQNPVFVPQDSVPASAASVVHGLIACPSNALELKNGGLRVENMTVLPPNPLFLLLALLTFGLEPSNPSLWSIPDEQSGCEELEEIKVSAKIRKSMDWLRKRWKRKEGLAGASNSMNTVDVFPQKLDEGNAKARMEKAIAFDKDASSQGERLLCFPSSVKVLCELFSWVDGYECEVWDTLEEESLTSSNIASWQKEKRCVEVKPSNDSGTRQPSPSPSIQPSTGAASKSPEDVKETLVDESTAAPKKAAPKVDNKVTFIVSTKSTEVPLDSQSFPHNSVPIQHLGAVSPADEYTAWFKLRQLVTEYKKWKFQLQNPGQEGDISSPLNPDDWNVRAFEAEDGTIYYFARYTLPDLPLVGFQNRGKKRLPDWIKNRIGRPKTKDEMMACLAPGRSAPPVFAVRYKKTVRLVFENIHDAFNMEAAFYLESQFARSLSKKKSLHWYNYTIQEMMWVLRQGRVWKKSEKIE